MHKLRSVFVGLVLLLALTGLGLVVFSQRTSVSRDFPVYDNGGKPDLTVDPKRFVSQMEIVDRLFEEGSCAVIEGAVNGTGYRRILRFDTVVMNSGDADLIIGDRGDPNNPYHEFFEFALCHGHYHIRDFSVYELVNPAAGNVVIAGHKQGFCFTDSFKYDGGKSNGYNCTNQGITSGWADWYYKQLTGQWIDITGVPEGDYVVRVSINLFPIFDEGSDQYTNVVEAPIHVPNPRNKVDVDNSAELIDK